MAIDTFSINRYHWKPPSPPKMAKIKLLSINYSAFPSPPLTAPTKLARYSSIYSLSRRSSEDYVSAETLVSMASSASALVDSSSSIERWILAGEAHPARRAPIPLRKDYHRSPRLLRAFQQSTLNGEPTLIPWGSQPSHSPAIMDTGFYSLRFCPRLAPRAAPSASRILNTTFRGPVPRYQAARYHQSWLLISYTTEPHSVLYSQDVGHGRDIFDKERFLPLKNTATMIPGRRKQNEATNRPSPVLSPAPAPAPTRNGSTNNTGPSNKHSLSTTRLTWGFSGPRSEINTSNGSPTTPSGVRAVFNAYSIAPTVIYRGRPTTSCSSFDTTMKWKIWMKASMTCVRRKTRSEIMKCPTISMGVGTCLLLSIKRLISSAVSKTFPCLRGFLRFWPMKRMNGSSQKIEQWPRNLSREDSSRVGNGENGCGKPIQRGFTSLTTAAQGSYQQEESEDMQEIREANKMIMFLCFPTSLPTNSVTRVLHTRFVTTVFFFYFSISSRPYLALCTILTSCLSLNFTYSLLSLSFLILVICLSLPLV